MKREAIQKLRGLVLNDQGEPSRFQGEKATFAEVFDELETVGFFTDRRLVIVDDADPFVTRFRAALEKKFPPLLKNSNSTGVLILDVKTWPANTKLAKMVDANATITCKAPPAYRLGAWCQEWTAARFDKQLLARAAESLVNFVGTDMGILHQELEKIAIYIGDRKQIQPEDVDRLVGRSREESTFKIFDSLAAGNVGAALGILAHVLDQGDEPMKILGAFGFQLRKLAQATRLTRLGRNLTAALQESGIPPFGLKTAEKHLQMLGRQRASLIHDWLLEINMGLRGSSSLPQRTQLEKLVIRLAGKIQS